MISEMLISKTMDTMLLHFNVDASVAVITLEYLITGMVAVYQHWFNSGRRESIEVLSETLSTLAFYGINGFKSGGKDFA